MISPTPTPSRRRNVTVITEAEQPAVETCDDGTEGTCATVVANPSFTG